MSNIIHCQSIKTRVEESLKEEQNINIAKEISKQLTICKQYKRVEKTNKNRWLFHIGYTNEKPHARLELLENGEICWSFFGENESFCEVFEDYKKGTKELIKKFLKYEK